MQGNVRKAVVLAAGLNARMLPLSKIIPKAALPIGNRPAFHFLVDECIKSGVREIVFVVREKNSIIKKYFSQDTRLEKLLKNRKEGRRLAAINKIKQKCKMSFVVQEEPLGEANALLKAGAKIGNSACVVLYGDTVYMAKVPAAKQAIDLFNEKGKNVYGIVGRFVLKPEIFKLLGKVKYQGRGNALKGKGISIPFVLSKLMDKNEFIEYMVKGKRFDLGMPKRYSNAFNSLSNTKKK